MVSQVPSTDPSELYAMEKADRMLPVAVKAGGRAGVGFPQGAERAPTPSRAAVVPLHMSPSLFSLTVPLCCAPSPRTRENTEKPHQHPQGHAEARQVRPEPPPAAWEQQPHSAQGSPTQGPLFPAGGCGQDWHQGLAPGPPPLRGSSSPQSAQGSPTQGPVVPSRWPRPGPGPHAPWEQQLWICSGDARSLVHLEKGRIIEESPCERELCELGIRVLALCLCPSLLTTRASEDGQRAPWLTAQTSPRGWLPLWWGMTWRPLSFQGGVVRRP